MSSNVQAKIPQRRRYGLEGEIRRSPATCRVFPLLPLYFTHRFFSLSEW